MGILLSAKKTASAIGIPLGTLYRLSRAGLVPTYRIGVKRRSLRFKVPEVMDVLRREPAKTLGDNNGRLICQKHD
jgi:hypothetical protein